MNLRYLVMSALCCIVGVAVRFDTDDYRHFLAIVKSAWAGISFKDRCWAMGLDKGQLSRIESGVEALHAHRLAMLGAKFPEFFQRLAVMLVAAHGLAPDAKAAAALHNAFGEQRLAS
jgi:hypothetical protein